MCEQTLSALNRGHCTVFTDFPHSFNVFLILAGLFFSRSSYWSRQLLPERTKAKKPSRSGLNLIASDSGNEIYVVKTEKWQAA